MMSAHVLVSENFSDKAGEMFSLDSTYSTTRRVTSTLPIISDESYRKLDSALFQPSSAGRKGEGGLRTKGLFKADTSAFKQFPRITVITVVFNAGETLEQTILSVISQSYDNVEYIIVDAGSSDNSLDIIRKYEHAIDYWVSEPDAGIYDAWNKGVRLASGEWIAFLGADDVYLEGAIQAYINLIVSCGDRIPDYMSSRVNLTTGLKVIRTIGQPWNWKTFRKYMNVAHVGSFHRRRLFEKYGVYDISYKICGDYELLLRPKADLRTAYMKKITVNMRVGGVSDGNFRVFGESAKAKTNAGGRNALICFIEKSLAICKWKLRNWLWY
jgi:glycosyltransferase involved in cell wall biosynthesis